MKTYSILAASLLAAIVLTLSPGVVQAVVIAESDFLDLNGDGELTNDTDGIGWSGGWNEVDEDGEMVIQAMTKSYFDSDYEIRSILRTLFNSEYFKSEKARFARMKGPVELIVGAVRMAGAYQDPTIGRR